MLQCKVQVHGNGTFLHLESLALPWHTQDMVDDRDTQGRSATYERGLSVQLLVQRKDTYQLEDDDDDSIGSMVSLAGKFSHQDFACSWYHYTHFYPHWCQPPSRAHSSSPLLTSHPI